MRHGPRTSARRVAAGVLVLLGTSGCALVSGLADLAVDEGPDASLADGGADVTLDATRDRSADAPSPPPPGADVVQPPADASGDGAPDASVPAIQCGTSTCPLTEVCCNHVANGKSTFTCGDAGTCKGNGDYVMACDALSCGAGKRCCAQLTFQGGTVATSAACTASCPTGMTLCRSDAGDASPSCNLGFSCQPSQQLGGYEGCQF